MPHFVRHDRPASISTLHHNELRLLEAWATAVRRRGLQVPALFMLEAAQPLRYLLQQVCWLAQPLLGQRAMLWAMLLEDERTLTELQERIGAAAQGSCHNGQHKG